MQAKHEHQIWFWAVDRAYFGSAKFQEVNLIDSGYWLLERVVLPMDGREKMPESKTSIISGGSHSAWNLCREALPPLYSDFMLFH